MLQEEPLQPLALEPLTEEEQVGRGRGGAGRWVFPCRGAAGELGSRRWGLLFWAGVRGAGVWVLTPTPGSLLRETSPCQ